jgi:hypothetical protein
MEVKALGMYIAELNKLGKGSKLAKLRMTKTEDIRILNETCLEQEHFEICECIKVVLKERKETL